MRTGLHSAMGKLAMVLLQAQGIPSFPFSQVDNGADNAEN